MVKGSRHYSFPFSASGFVSGYNYYAYDILCVCIRIIANVTTVILYCRRKWGLVHISSCQEFSIMYSENFKIGSYVCFIGTDN